MWWESLKKSIGASKTKKNKIKWNRTRKIKKKTNQSTRGKR